MPKPIRLSLCVSVEPSEGEICELMKKKYQLIWISAWLLPVLLPAGTTAQNGYIIDLKPSDERLYAPTAPS